MGSYQRTPGGGGGGGGGATSWLQVVCSGQTIEPGGAGEHLSFGDASDPAPRGTKIDWDIATPTVVTITADGVFDVSFYVDIGGAGDPMNVATYVVLNDDSVGPLYYWVQRGIGGLCVPGVALEIGDELRLLAVNSDAGDMGVSTGVLTVAEVA